VTHGPIVGAVSDTSATVFVRASKPARVRILYSTDPSFASDLHLSSYVVATSAGDLTAQIPITDLLPSTTYFLKVVLGGKVQDAAYDHRFTTAPPSEDFVDFEFAVLSDLADIAPSGAPAYASVASENPAFVLQIGDFDHRNPGSRRRPSITIENWRKMHRDVLQDNPSGRDFARYITPFFPLYHIWDDHDYGDNNADRTAWWNDLAAQAFREYYPLPALPNPEGGLWYSFRYAQAEFFVLDLRSQRDPDNDPRVPEPSMLDGGAIPNDQKNWLKESLAGSTARWKFIISSSVWNPNSKRIDSWYGHRQEQDELVGYIRGMGITGVVIISGDLHSGGGIDDGTNSFFPELSVPTTDVRLLSGCTGGFCGSWSEGIVTGIDPSGYAMIHVQHDEVTDTDEVLLQAKAEDGSLRLEYLVELP
jgi:alkaline phosphatase D